MLHLIKKILLLFFTSNQTMPNNQKNKMNNNLKIYNKLYYWINALNLKIWVITTEEILPEQVTYGDYVPQKDRYFVGIEIDKENKIGTIYHDRELTEADIIHELLHVKYPSKDEDWINTTENIISNQ